MQKAKSKDLAFFYYPYQPHNPYDPYRYMSLTCRASQAIYARPKSAAPL